MEEIKKVVIENEELAEPVMDAVVENVVIEDVSKTNFKAIGLGIVAGITVTYVLPKAIKYIRDERHKRKLNKLEEQTMENVSYEFEDSLFEDDSNFEDINK